MATSYLVESSAQDLPKDIFLKWWDDVCCGKLKGTKGVLYHTYFTCSFYTLTNFRANEW
jgi:hypothetical protein